jgi:hypothetical protein
MTVQAIKLGRKCLRVDVNVDLIKVKTFDYFNPLSRQRISERWTF